MRTTTQDPLAEKYYDISPYAWCANNPVNLVDPDGKKTRIYVETQGLGHTFITTGIGKETIVYTYGRYNGTYKDKVFLESTSPIGDGVLLIKRDVDALNYLKEENDKNVKIYELLNINDSDIDLIFTNLFDSSDKIPLKYPDSGKIIDVYNLLTNNCTTKVLDVVNTLDEDFNVNTFVPFFLNTWLHIKTMENESEIKKINFNDILKEYDTKE